MMILLLQRADIISFTPARLTRKNNVGISVKNNFDFILRQYCTIGSYYGFGICGAQRTCGFSHNVLQGLRQKLWGHLEAAFAVSFNIRLLFIASPRCFLPLFFHDEQGLHEQYPQFLQKIHAFKYQSFSQNRKGPRSRRGQGACAGRRTISVSLQSPFNL